MIPKWQIKRVVLTINKISVNSCEVELKTLLFLYIQLGRSLSKLLDYMLHIFV